MHRTRQLQLLLATLAITVTSQQRITAQTLEWLRQFGSTEADTAHSVSADALGNIYVSGFTRGSMGGPFQGIHDGFFAKYDADGRQLWAKQLGTSGQETAWSISADGFGNVYVEGDTSGNLFGSTLGPWDVWLAKYDGNGNLLWGRQIESSADEEYGTVVVDPLGGVYISAATNGSLGGTYDGNGHDQFLSKYSASGDLLWTRQISSPGYDWYSRISPDGLGNVYIAARTEGNLVAPNAGSRDAYLAKYDRDGALLWARQFGTSAHDTITGGVSADALGNVYVLGSTEGSLGGPNAGGSDIFLTKFNADGIRLWSRQFGTSKNDYGDYLFGGGVATDGRGNVYVTANIGHMSSGQTDGGDVLIAKYDTNGDVMWSEQIGSPQGEGRDRISTDGKGSVYFSGYTQGSFGGPLSGGQDAFLGKIRDESFLGGDFNGNGTVDTADYLVWRNGMGTTYTQADYGTWRAHFGQSAAISSSHTSIAEPTVGVLCLAVLLTLGSNFRTATRRCRTLAPGSNFAAG